MGSFNLIEYIVIAFPYHLLCSSGASYPFACHLEWCSVYFSFISHKHPPSPILPPPPSCFSPSSSPVILQEDRGGHLTLQKRWTSFLKTRLTCSLPEYDFHFNMLRSVFALPGQTPQDMLFYGIFGPEWWVRICMLPRWLIGRVFEDANANEWDGDERQQSMHWDNQRRREGTGWKTEGISLSRRCEKKLIAEV